VLDDEESGELFREGDDEIESDKYPGTDFFGSREDCCSLLVLVHRFVDEGCRRDGKAFAYNDLKSTMISFTRQFYFVQQILAVFMPMHERGDFNKYTSWGCRFVINRLVHGLHGLGMAPFEKIIKEGKAQDFITLLPSIANLLCVFHRDKVWRPTTVYMMAFLQWSPELVQFYFENCTVFTDHYIELFNSCVSRICPPAPTVEDVARASS